MTSLQKSRWAPASEENKKDSSSSSSSHSRPSGLLSPAAELSRFMKIVARLKWKLPFLAEGYRLATLPPETGIDFDIAQAEIMFKLDFHEYYALLERALVHLLGVFGIAVSGVPKNAGWAGSGSGLASHRYHANVLDALDAKSSPLRSVLGSGSGERFTQLKRAKELRNRWKTADLSQEEKEREEASFYSARAQKVMPLESYDLEKILTVIFEGLEDAYRLAETYAAEHDTASNGRGEAAGADMDWDFIVDAMDWEAV
ncbi:hypothetical protein BJX66DRAFT_172663 [Aspergillus keveii]|uniref:Fungal specific transcription factor n=1 Tax=Aspergillus keveii TaxID=714993 RepID=A0ABR4G801_9EURO